MTDEIEPFTITPEMSEASRKKAEQEALDNAAQVTQSIDDEASSGKNRDTDADPTVETQGE